MSDISPEKLKRLLMEAYLAQIRQLQKDLEIRFAAVLKVNTDLPSATGIAMSVAVSQQLSDMVTSVTVIEADKIVSRAL